MKLFQCMMIDLTTMSMEQKFIQVEDKWNPKDLMIKYIDPSSEHFQEELQFYSELEILNLNETGFTLDFEDAILIFKDQSIIPFMMKECCDFVVDLIEEDFHLIDPQINNILEKLVNKEEEYVPNDWEAEINPNSSDGDYQYPD